MSEKLKNSLVISKCLKALVLLLIYQVSYAIERSDAKVLLLSKETGYTAPAGGAKDGARHY